MGVINKAENARGCGSSTRLVLENIQSRLARPRRKMVMDIGSQGFNEGG